MTRVVNYLMSGDAHMPYLVVSLHTLRTYYDGPIEVYAYPNCFGMLKQIEKDKKLRIEAKLWKPSYEKKNSQFVTKIEMCQQPGYDVRLYLDADTSIHGPVDELFEAAEKHGMCITQFNDWVSTGRLISARVSRLKEFPAINQKAVEAVLAKAYPSPNGGIFAVQPGSQVLPVWRSWSWEAISIFICDEAVLHLMPYIYGGQHLHVCEGGKYNCSHKYGKHLRKNGLEPHIFHYHGNSCVRPQKSKEAVDTWLGLFQECKALNIGRVNDWKDQVTRNKHLNKLREDPEYADLV